MADWRERLLQFWNRFEGRQKYALIGGFLALIALIVGISFWYGSKPEMVPLYTNLESKDAGEIVASLKESGIEYSLEETRDGTTIYVLPKNVLETRMNLATAGLPRGNKGFEIFDDSKIGTTEFQNRVNYLQAIQGELARTIEQLDKVAKARVHIVMPEDSLYKKNEKPATASIMLVIRGDEPLKRREVNGIVNLVANSVQTLTPNNITVVDETGKILNEEEDEDLEKQKRMSMQSDLQLKLTKAVRNNLQDNVQSMLDDALGEGNAYVRVSVELDFDDKEINRQTFTPVVDDAGIIRSQQDVSESYNGTSTTPGGAAGVESNVPGYVEEEGEANAEYERKESTKNYEINEENQKIIASHGSIKRLTVAVLVDDSITEEQQEGLVRLVSSAAGIDLDRGDTVSVEVLPFSTDVRERKTLEEIKAEELRSRTFYMELGFLLLLLSFIAGGFLMYRNKRLREREIEAEIARREEEERQRLEAERRDLEAQQRAAEEKMTPEERQSRNEKELIQSLIDQRPQEVAMLLKTWLAED